MNNFVRGCIYQKKKRCVFNVLHLERGDITVVVILLAHKQYYYCFTFIRLPFAVVLSKTITEIFFIEAQAYKASDFI